MASRDIAVLGSELNPIYCVLLIQEGDGEPATWARETLHVFGGDVEDVLHFATEQAGDERMFAVAVETAFGGLQDGPPQYLRTWISGCDPVFPDELSEAAFLTMRRRQNAGN